MSQRAVDAEAFLAMVEPPVNISEPDFGPLIGLDGGYANVTVEAARFYAIDPDAPSAAIGLDTLYGPSGEGGWYGYDGFGASDNAGPGRWLAAFVAEDWDTGQTHRLELHLLNDSGAVIDSAYLLELEWTGWSGDAPFGYPWIAKVYRWGDVNLVLFLGASGGQDSVFGVLVSTDGGSISAGSPVELTDIAYPGFNFAAASGTEGAVVTEKSGTQEGWTFTNIPDAEIVRLTRSGLSLSAGSSSTFFIGTGWVNGIAHHDGDVYIVAHESFTDPVFGNSNVARAVSPGSGVIDSMELPNSAGGLLYQNLQNNNMRGDQVLKHSGGYAAIWRHAFNSTYADLITFDGSTLGHAGETLGPVGPQSGRDAIRTAQLEDGWLTISHDRYWLWSEDLSSVESEGFTNLRDLSGPSGTWHFPTQLPDTP